MANLALKQPKYGDDVQINLDLLSVNDNDSDIDPLIATTPAPVVTSFDDIELYYAEGECYIYRQIGNSNGSPKTKRCIIYDTEPNEVVALAKDTDVDEKEYKHQDNSLLLEKNNLNKSQSFKRDYTQQKFIKINQEFGSLSSTDDINQPEDKSGFLKKLMESKVVKKTILFMRCHPFIPGLIILLIQAGIEILAIFDLYTDVVVTLQLRESQNPILFGISAGLVAAPFVIAWAVASHTILAKYEKAHREHKWQRLWSIFLALYDIAPIGVLMILAFEIYHWLETIIIIPIVWTCTGGLRHRTIGYQELGFYKLRKVSEVFAESLPQAIFQLFILLGIFGSAACDKCTLSAVIQSLITSIVVATLWCTILFFEARKNGLSFGEYVTITFQGSFDFVPKLPAIERGNKMGESVNWTNFKIRQQSFGSISKSVYSKQCKLKTLKCSQYTIDNLDRISCKFLGSRLKILSVRNNLQIIISRDEQQLHQLFAKYDTDKSESFDFLEFVYFYLSINSAVKEKSIMDDITQVWFKIMDKHSHQIWMLDLLLQATTSIDYIPLIDYKSPLLIASQSNNINLISFLMASYDYHLANQFNKIEFEICVKRAVVENNLKLAATLCENIGVPIVVEIKSGKDLELQHIENDNYMNPFVTVKILGQEKTSTIYKESNNPLWNDKILFFIEFEIINDLINNFIQTDNIQFQNDSKLDFLQNKSMQELDEMELKKYAKQSYQKVKKRRKWIYKDQSGKQKKLDYDKLNDMSSSESDEKSVSLDIDGDDNYKLPRYLSVLQKQESHSLEIGRKLQRQPSDFQHYILQKEQGYLIVKYTVHSKHYDEENKDDIDKYIGKKNVIINLKQDLSKYGENSRRYHLSHSLKKGGELINCGELISKIHLNMFQVYHDAFAKCKDYKKTNPLSTKPMSVIIDTDL